MNRIRKKIQEAQQTKQKMFCAFTTTGFPSLEETEELILGFEKIGVDILELAFPFSDPLADGPVIQAVSYQAIEKGVHIEDFFQVVKNIRQKGCEIPIVFFTYFNPVHHYGFGKLVNKMVEVGCDGLLCPDLPLDYEEELPTLIESKGLSYIRLIAPNTTPERKRKILKKTKDFVYYVSRKGITGMKKALSGSIKEEVLELKSYADKSVFVGFGVSSAQHVREVVRYADGAIVGSAIVKMLDETKSVSKTLAFTKELIQGLSK